MNIARNARKHSILSSDCSLPDIGNVTNTGTLMFPDLPILREGLACETKVIIILSHITLSYMVKKALVNKSYNIIMKCACPCYIIMEVGNKQ